MKLETSIEAHVRELKEAVMGDIALMANSILDEGEISKEIDRVIAVAISSWRFRFALMESGDVGLQFSSAGDFDGETLTVPMAAQPDDTQSLISAIDTAIEKLEIYRGKVVAEVR